MAGVGYERYWDCGLAWDALLNKTVLVTGAGGLIASHVVECLWQANRDLGLNLTVLAMVRSAERAQARLGAFLTGDGCVRLLVQDVVEPLAYNGPIDFYVHAASSAHPGAFNTVPADVMRANFLGTMNMLDHARDHGGRVMFVSSSEVYGENEEGKELFCEDDNGSVNFARFRACYPESKRAAETLCQCYAKQYGTDVVVVRPAFIFGREVIDSNVRADAYFMRQALAREDIVMKSAAGQVRSYLYVKDCALAMLYVLLAGERAGTYNIGDASCVVTLREYAQALADEAGVRLVDDFDEPQDAGTVFLKTTRCVLDDTRLRGLGWRPAYTLRQGIAESLFVAHEKSVL